MWLDEIPRPVIIAHRGSSAYAPENTLAAFKLAIEQGAHAIELDTKLTADGQVVVIHDQTVDRTTGHSGRVRDLTLNELRELEAGSHFDQSFRGEPIPTLDDVFKVIDQSIWVNIEVANYASPTDALPLKVAESVQRNQMEQRVLFSSFNILALKRIRHLIPTAPIGLLTLGGRKGVFARQVFGRLINYQSLHPRVGDVNAELLHKVHRQNRKLFVYTVNRADDLRQMFQLGVDGVITDDPLLAIQVLRALP